MPTINLRDIDPGCVYDADAIAALFLIHRTTVHKQVFPRITTQRIGRRETATGEQLIKYARGETNGS
jgi:hypothetical protein